MFMFRMFTRRFSTARPLGLEDSPAPPPEAPPEAPVLFGWRPFDRHPEKNYHADTAEDTMPAKMNTLPANSVGCMLGCAMSPPVESVTRLWP